MQLDTILSDLGFSERDTGYGYIVKLMSLIVEQERFIVNENYNILAEFFGVDQRFVYDQIARAIESARLNGGLHKVNNYLKKNVCNCDVAMTNSEFIYLMTLICNAKDNDGK